MKCDDFDDVDDAILNDLPIYTIIMKYDDGTPIIEDCSPKVSMGYFQSVI